MPGGESLSAIDNKVAVIAEALGKTAAGDALRQQLQQQIAAIPTQPVAKRVLFILSHGGMNTRWPDSIPRPADGAIRAAGLQNAMQGFDHYRAMSQEGVAASQADLVGDLRRWSQRDGRRSRSCGNCPAGADPGGAS